MASDSVVDERTLRELYLTGFEIVVKEAKPKTIMSSYNLINGTYANENRHLLMDILRGEWGFDGAVVTDWGGSNDHALGVQNGSTLEMPAPGGDAVRELMQAVQSGKITEADVDARLDELLTLVFDTHAAVQSHSRTFDADAHHALARRAAAESIVLLKNENDLLPLAEGAKVAVIGDFAQTPRYQGAGSSAVNSIKVDTFLDCLKESGLASVGFASGFDRQGKPDAAKQAEAVALAQKAEVVLLCLGLDEIKESEGLDRGDMHLADNQIELLKAVQQANPNTVVVLSAGASLETPWLKHCRTLVYGALGGQAGAGAMLDVLNVELAQQGEAIQQRRRAYLAALSPLACANYEELSRGAETLSLRYAAQFEPGGLAQLLRQKMPEELRAGQSLCGPHREDLDLLLDGQPAKVYASQGQQRSVVLSLKMAEAAAAASITGEHPVMLLDDVLSELDDGRKQYLLTRMREKQTFVTSCDDTAFLKTDGEVYRMNGGVLTKV